MEYDDIYEILDRIQNARRLIENMDIEGAKRILKNLENDLKKVIYHEVIE